MLPNNFMFSQKVLQTYVDCPRRFELQFLLRQPWPAVVTQPIVEMENHLEMGRDFHKMVQQYVSGVPNTDIASQIRNPRLLEWWQAFLAHGPGIDPLSCTAESKVSTKLNRFPLIAQYDLIQIGGQNTIEIMDWKTTAIPLTRAWLQKRLQTKVYLFVMGKVRGQYGNEGQLDQISLRYWFPQHPSNESIFSFSADQFQTVEVELGSLIAEIANHGEIYALTEDEKLCQFCQYRSLCDRGGKAGDFHMLADVDTAGVPEIDLDQVTEIPF
jgi:hypothetical protein